MRLAMLVGALLYTVFAGAFVRAGDLDTAFNTDARLFGIGRTVAMQADGKVLVGGSFTLADGGSSSYVARFNADGTRDETFLIGMALDGPVRSIAVQADGKIVIGGSFLNYGATPRARIARLNADGTLDTGFVPGTGCNEEVLSLAVQSDGKIVLVGVFTSVAGVTRNRVARLNGDGTLDTTFLNTGAAANGIVWDVALQANGQAIVVGAFTTYNGTARGGVARLTTAGALDTTFLNTGAGASGGAVVAAAIDSTGRPVIGGLFTAYNGTARTGIARLTTAGALDGTFAPATGFSYAGEYILDLKIDSADRIVISGQFSTYDNIGTAVPGLLRLNGAAADPTFALPGDSFALNRAGFGSSGRYVDAMAIGPGDAVVVVGSIFDKASGQAGVLRFANSGARDTVFNSRRGLGFEPIINVVRPARAGAYLVAGSFDWIGGARRVDIARFLPNARVDPAFGAYDSAYFDAPIGEAVELSDGRVWVFGSFTNVAGQTRAGIARLDANGGLNYNSPLPTVGGGLVRRALVNSAGQMLLAGSFTTINGTARAGVARMDAAGVLDGTFAPGSGPSGGQIVDAAVDSTDRLIVAGDFTSFSGTNEAFLVRLGTTGNVDSGFAANTDVSGLVNSVQVLSGDQVLIGGAFANSGGYAVNGIDRLNADGTSDSGFNPGTGANSYVYTARADTAGRIALGGAFTAVRGEARPGGLAVLESGGDLNPLYASTTLGGGYVGDLLPLPDGKLLARGTFKAVEGSTRLGLARFHTAPARRGALDSALAGAVLANQPVRAVLPTADGGFVLAGEFTSFGGQTRNRIVKIDAYGAIDPTFPYNGGFNATVYGGLVQPDGKLLLWGGFSSYNNAGCSAVIRLNADGSRDNGFTAPVFNSTVRVVARRSDGASYVGGAFTSVGGVASGGLVRLNADGTRDGSFTAGTATNGAVLALTVAADGGVYAGGEFTTMAGLPAPGLVKLTTAGARAAGFDIGTGSANPSAPVRALALQADGKLIVGGAFTAFNGETVTGLLRLNVDGTRDAAFLGGFGADGPVNALSRLNDGRLYVGGAFGALGGGEHRGLARLTAAGLIDSVFDVGTGVTGVANQEVLTLAVMADGRLAVGGSFATVSGASRDRFAILFASDEGAPFIANDQLATVEVNPGESFVLSLGAPVAGLRYQWYRDGVRLDGATSSEYSVAAAALGDIGLYTAVISNGAGAYTTAGTQVTVRLAPGVVSATSTQAVGYGAAATFAVNANGPGPFTYQWFRNGVEIPGANASSYTLTNVGAGDFGAEFFVRITNVFGSTDTTPATLTFDSAAVPGALAAAFPAGAATLASAPTAFLRQANGQYYVGGSGYLRRLNSDGTADATFAPLLTSISVNALAVQTDGKLVVIGSIQPTGGSVRQIARFLASGALDPAFTTPTVERAYYDGSGNVLFYGTGSLVALAIQADGKIVIGGNFARIAAVNRQHLARLGTDGTLDTTFAPADNASGPNGPVTAVRVQGTNLLVAGSFTTYRNTTVNRLALVSSTNTLATFSGGTRADNTIADVVVQTDGKLLIRGDFLNYGGVVRNRVARLNADGSLDTTFNPGTGPAFNSYDTPVIRGVAADANGAVVIIGNFIGFSNWPAVGAVRLTSTGAIDTQWATLGVSQYFNNLFALGDGSLFASGGMAVSGVGSVNFARLLGGIYPPQPPAIAVPPTAGVSAYAAGSRLQLSALASGPGALTFQWYRNGTAVTDSTTVTGATTPVLTLRSLRVAEAGAYVLRVTSSTTGATDSAAAGVAVNPELSGPGSLDLGWAADAVPRTLAVYPMSDGSAISVSNAYNDAAGQYYYFLDQYDANGFRQPTTTFQQGSGFDGSISKVVRQADGKLVVGGFFANALGTARGGLARVTTGGTLDATFNPAPAGASLYDVAQQADGKLIVAGTFTTMAGVSRTHVARLTSTGANDATFANAAHGLNFVRRVLVDSAGRVYLLGVSGTTFTDDIVRLTSAGALDAGFTRVSAPSYSIATLALDSSDRLVVAGSFTSIGGVNRNRAARILTTGVVDPAFGPIRSAGPSTDVQSVVIGSDGWIYLLLNFGTPTYDGFARAAVVRLDGNGQVDLNFPGDGAMPLQNPGSSGLAWTNGQLTLYGFFSGLARSSWVRLNVGGGSSGAPSLADSSGDRVVAEGLGLALFARFTGASPMTYVWQKDGVTITGAIGPQLVLTSPGAADAGTYTVTATNGSGSQSASMVVSFLPVDPLSPMAGISLSTGFSGTVQTAVRRADGGILAGGSFTTVDGISRRGLVAFNPDGSLNTAFNNALPFSNSAQVDVQTVAIESDGRILVHGTLTMSDNSTTYLVRLNSTGSLANVLLSNPTTNTAPTRMVLRPDGSIILAGSFSTIAGTARAGLARLLANGSLDNAFGSAGLTGSVSAIMAYPDNRILLGGYINSASGTVLPSSTRVVRLNSDGTVDGTFVSGLTNGGSPTGFYLTGDGRLLAFGSSYLIQTNGSYLGLVQLADNGSVDPTFSSDFSAATAVAEDGLGRLFVNGTRNSSTYVARLLAGGATDRAVPFYSQIPAMVGLSDRILVAGGSALGSVNNVLVRGLTYLNAGPAEALAMVVPPQPVTGAEGGTVILSAGIRGAEGGTFQWYRNGQIVPGATGPVLVLSGLTVAEAGDYTLTVTTAGDQITTSAVAVTVAGNQARAGEVDLAWGAGLNVSGINRMTRDGAGNLFLAGNVSINGGIGRPLVALAADGTGRGDFTLSARVAGSAAAAQVLADGKILLAAGYNSLLLDGTSRPLVRLTADGSVDDSFTVTGVTGTVQRAVELAGGQLLVVGGGIGAGSKASGRLSAAGVVDGTYTGVDGNITDIVPAADGKWWVMGSSYLPTFNYATIGVWRLNADGTADTSFQGVIMRSSESVQAIAAAPDGGVFVLCQWYLSGAPASIRRLERYTATGAIDPQFLPGQIRIEAGESNFSAMAVDAAGRLLLGGGFSSYDGVTRRKIVRLLADGAADPSFVSVPTAGNNPASGPQQILVQPSGRIILLGSSLSGFGGLSDRSGIFALHGAEAPGQTAPAVTGTVADVTLARFDRLSLGLPVFAPTGASIQWYKDGAPLDGATAARYSLQGAGSDATGSYHATVTTAGGTVATGSVKVAVPAADYSGGLEARNALTLLDSPPQFAVGQPDGRILVVTGMPVVVNGHAPAELFRLNADGTLAEVLPTIVNGSGSQGSSSISAAVVDATGRIYLGGQFTSVNGVTRNRVARLNADGTLDTGWDAGTGPNSTVTRLALGPSGTLYIGGNFGQVAGTPRQYLARLTATGALDLDFVVGTSLNGTPNALVVQSDGRPIVGGTFSSYNGITVTRLIRINLDGSLDGTFAPAPNNTVTAMAVENDDRILVGGNFGQIGGLARTGLAWLATDGSVATTTLNYTSGYSAIALAADGGAFALTGTQVHRFRADGSRDTTFTNANGYRGNFTNGSPSPSAINPQSLVAVSNGVLVVGPFFKSGAALRNGLAWLGTNDGLLPVITNPPANADLPSGGTVTWNATASTSTGTLTYTWTRTDAPGTVLGTSAALTLTNVMPADAGTYRVVVSNGEGNTEALVQLTVRAAPSFGPGSPRLDFYRVPYGGQVCGVIPAGDGRFWVANSSGLQRLLGDGKVDPAFASLTPTGGTVDGITPVPDGSFYVWGSFTSLGGQPASRVARLTANGAIDAGFVAPLTSQVTALAVDATGKVYVGGSFTGVPVGGKSTDRFVRLNADGSVDAAFDPNGGLDGSPSDIRPLADGRVLVAGSFNTAGGSARRGLVRFLAGGALDGTFNNIDVNNVLRVAVLGDGRILIGGAFSTVDGLTRPRLARLSANGVVDPTFSVTGVVPASLYALLVRPDGRIVIAGGVTDTSGSPARVYQLMPDGTVDPTFNYLHSFNTTSTITTSNAGLSGATLLATGNLFVWGSFNYVDDGIYRPGLVRLQGTPLAPEITASVLADASVDLGDAVTFAVTATGAPTLTYQWRRDGTALPGEVGSTLVLDPVTAGDAGVYDVVVTNTYGFATSAMANLTLNTQAQTITFDSLPDLAFTATPITLTATATSGLAVAFEVVAGEASVVGDQLTLLGTGEITVRATQAGNGAFLPADPVELTINVSGSYAYWQLDHFSGPEILTPAVSGPNADFDGDGFSNLVEYALGLDPKIPSTAGLPSVSTDATYWYYTVTRPTDRPDLTYAVEYSTNLTVWNAVGGADISTVNNGVTVEIKARQTLSTANVFFRLKVTQQ